MDIANYYRLSEGDKQEGRALNSATPGTSQASILKVARKCNVAREN